MRVTVVGAGVSGLTTAVVLSRNGHDVTILTRDEPLRTVSAVAGAAWYPIRGERDARADDWLRASYRVFASLDARAGVVMRRARELLREPRSDEGWSDLLPGFVHVAPPPGFTDAWEAAPIPIADMSVYLGWLVRAVRGRARIVSATVGSLDGLPGDVVVNCAGLGARALADDASVEPIRGQVVRVEQVGLDTMVLDEQNPQGVTYIIPRARDIVLGGVRDVGNDDVGWDPDQARAFVARCIALEPRLANARITSRAVGLRPGRPSVRLEREGRVIHNYGHGGSGVALSWGCAAAVAALVEA